MPLYPVDKPLGLTSFDVVARARRILGVKKIGHTGTLDPLATGVLILCVGDSTKLVQFLTADRKDYLAFVALGASTVTLDAEGPILEQVEQVELPTPQALEGALKSLHGPQLQIPPQYSAIQVGGKRAYDVARSGGQLELPARPVTFFQLEHLKTLRNMDEARALYFAPSEQGWSPAPEGRSFDFPPALGNFPILMLRASVSSGTYLRSLARDLGEALGFPAHLAGLIRTSAGRFTLEQTTSLENLAQAQPVNELDAMDLPRLEVDAQVARELREGKKPETPLEGRFVVLCGGALVAVIDALEGQMKSLRVWV